MEKTPVLPILPVVNWKGIFESGRQYPVWLSMGATIEHRDKMEVIRRSLILEPQVVTYLDGLPRPVHVVAIAEDWSGDVVRHVPVLQRFAEVAPNLKIHFISRGLYPDIFVRYLTNGEEALPKFIFLNNVWEECGNWGPMPAACMELTARGKACGDPRTARKKVRALYEVDTDRRMVQRELLRLIHIASSREP